MPTEKIQMTISRPGEGRSYQVLGAPVTVHSPSGSQCFTLADHPVPVGHEVPLHVHQEEDEAAYVLDGAVTFFTEEGETVAGPGTFVSLPRGVAHGFANRGPADARMIVFASAGGRLEGVFRDLDAVAREAPPEPAAVGAALERNGVTLLAG